MSKMDNGNSGEKCFFCNQSWKWKTHSGDCPYQAAIDGGALEMARLLDMADSFIIPEGAPEEDK